MKQKKDIPKKWQKYVRWVAVNKEGVRLDYFATTKADATRCLPVLTPNYRVEPALCLPLNLLCSLKGFQDDYHGEDTNDELVVTDKWF